MIDQSLLDLRLSFDGIIRSKQLLDGFELWNLNGTTEEEDGKRRRKIIVIIVFCLLTDYVIIDDDDDDAAAAVARASSLNRRSCPVYVSDDD